jgi:hypothetical protein
MKSPQRTVFKLEQEAEIESVYESLRREYPAHATYEAQLERCYLDTFDWRLYRNNRVCGWDIPTGNERKKSEGFFLSVTRKPAIVSADIRPIRLPGSRKILHTGHVAGFWATCLISER